MPKFCDKLVLWSSRISRKCLPTDQDHWRITALSQGNQQFLKNVRTERFLKNLYGFTTKALGEPSSGTLECHLEELEEQLSRTLSDEQRDDSLEPQEDLFLPAPPGKKKFEEGDISWKEVSDIVRNARSKSSPGPSGIPYLVYKRCGCWQMDASHQRSWILRESTCLEEFPY